MEIRPATAVAEVLAAGHLFDSAPLPGATEEFLADPRHHLLIAYVDDGSGAVPAGMVTGVETTHPDKGTEMFLYELGVDEPYRRRGVGRALVRALAGLARERGCYCLWTLTEVGNDAARATYLGAGGEPEDGLVLYSWQFDRD
ncbi:GNAT family N-acetyltransferase [Kitasatospora sp. NPDC054939]